MKPAQVSMNQLGEFIEAEMRNRNMGVNEFARFVGVGHSTISKALLPEPPDHKLDFLEKLAKATKVDLCTIVALIKPDAVVTRPGDQLLLARIARLPANKREMIDDLLRGVSLQSDE